MHAAWMIAGSFFFASMSVCVKFASPHFSTLENVFYRGVIGLVFMAALARSRKISLRTSVPMMHVWRNVMGVTAMAASFYALAQLPLATAMTLNYMSGVWVATFLIAGTVVMGRVTEIRRQGPLVMTVLAAFVGVIMLLRPTLDQNQLFAGLVGMLSGLLGAMAYIQVAALGRVGESETRTVFYFSLGGTVVGGAGMLLQGASNLARMEALWLLPMGILAALGQLCMTRAYTRGPAIVVANLQYTSIVFAALYGLILFGDIIPLMGWAGMALVISSAMAATVLRTRAAPNLPAEEH